jgi:peptidyl-prolyl cis-trans isomerase C
MPELRTWIALLSIVLTPIALAAAVPAAAGSVPETAAPAAAEAAAPAPEDGVIGRVNGEPLYLEDLERQLRKLHEQVEPGQRPDYDPERLVERLVNDVLLAQEARSLGLAEEEPIAGKVEALRRELAVKQLQQEEVWQGTEPSEEEVRALVERDYRRATLRVLTTYEEAGAAAALERLRGGAGFAELVEELSVDPYKDRGGLVADLARTDLQAEIADAAFAAEPGALVGPIRTSIGWSVVRVESFAPADPERFEERRTQAAQVLRYRRGQERQADLTLALRDQHPVAVDAAVLAGIEAERQPDGRLLPRVAEPDAVLATVGSQRVTAGELQKALAWRWKGIRNEEAARAALPLVLDDLIEERLVLAEALARGYDRIPAVARSAAAYETSLLVERYLVEVLGPQVEVEGEAMEAYYQEHLQAFHRPPRVHVSQITVGTEEEARRLAEQVGQGTDFAWLARRHSIDRFKDAGGERGWMYPMPGTDALSDQLLAASPGDVVEPFGAPDNWTLMRVNALEDQGPYPFDEVSGNVRSAVFQERFGKYIGGVLETLRGRAEIEVDAAALDALAITGRREEAEEPAGPAGGHGGGH